MDSLESFDIAEIFAESLRVGFIKGLYVLLEAMLNNIIPIIIFIVFIALIKFATYKLNQRSRKKKK